MSQTEKLIKQNKIITKILVTSLNFNKNSYLILSLCSHFSDYFINTFLRLVCLNPIQTRSTGRYSPCRPLHDFIPMLFNRVFHTLYFLWTHQLEYAPSDSDSFDLFCQAYFIGDAIYFTSLYIRSLTMFAFLSFCDSNPLLKYKRCTKKGTKVCSC